MGPVEEQPSGRAGSEGVLMFEQLDYLYVPSHDVASDVAYFTDVLGARLVFAIEVPQNPRVQCVVARSVG